MKLKTRRKKRQDEVGNTVERGKIGRCQDKQRKIEEKRAKGQLNYSSLGHGLSRQDADVTIIACHPATVAHDEQLLEAAYWKKRQTAASPTLRCNAHGTSFPWVRSGGVAPDMPSFQCAGHHLTGAKTDATYGKLKVARWTAARGLTLSHSTERAASRAWSCVKGSQWNAVRQTKSVARRVGEEVKGGRGFLKMMVSRKKEGG